MKKKKEKRKEKKKKKKKKTDSRFNQTSNFESDPDFSSI